MTLLSVCLHCRVQLLPCIEPPAVQAAPHNFGLPLVAAALGQSIQQLQVQQQQQADLARQQQQQLRQRRQPGAATTAAMGAAAATAAAAPAAAGNTPPATAVGIFGITGCKYIEDSYCAAHIRAASASPVLQQVAANGRPASGNASVAHMLNNTLNNTGKVGARASFTGFTPAVGSSGGGPSSTSNASNAAAAAAAVQTEVLNPPMNRLPLQTEAQGVRLQVSGTAVLYSSLAPHSTFAIAACYLPQPSATPYMGPRVFGRIWKAMTSLVLHWPAMP